jgi:hypothetical protein
MQINCCHRLFPVGYLSGCPQSVHVVTFTLSCEWCSVLPLVCAQEFVLWLLPSPSGQGIDLALTGGTRRQAETKTQGKRHDLSLKGAKHSYSPLGGLTKLFSPKFLIKINHKLKFITVNLCHRGGPRHLLAPSSATAKTRPLLACGTR